MKSLFVLWMLLLSFGVVAATPAEEKRFVDTYRNALNANNVAALHALLHTANADPEALGFYKMMMGIEAGSTIVDIRLRALNAEDRAQLAKSSSPDGRPMKMNVAPTLKLIIESERKSSEGSSKGKSEVFVAEVGGKLVLPVPTSSK